MSLDLIMQNAKSLMEASYTYDRQKMQKADKKEIEKTKAYIKKLLEDIKKNVAEERVKT